MKANASISDRRADSGPPIVRPTAGTSWDPDVVVRQINDGTRLLSPDSKRRISLQVSEDEVLHCDSEAPIAAGDRVAVEVGDMWVIGVVSRAYRSSAQSRCIVRLGATPIKIMKADTWRVARVCYVETNE